MRGPELDERQRIESARVHAAIDRIDADELAGGSLPTLAELREISSDRIVLGDVLGDFLHRVVVGTQAETISFWPVLELLRSAGADEEHAAAKAAWLRHQTEK